MNYRKIWKDHYGEIPIDENGITYDIHHIDGDKENNHISNLKAVSLEEHWKIHFEQGDYSAANMIADRLGKEIYSGWHHKEETKKKIGDANRGKKTNRFWITDGVINKLIKIGEKIPDYWKRGRTFDKEFSKKISLSLTGKTQSEDTKKKRAEKHKGKKRSEDTKEKMKLSWTKERKEEYSKWMSENRSGKNHPNYGKKPWNWKINN
jgi:hypothetical protein